MADETQTPPVKQGNDQSQEKGNHSYVKEAGRTRDDQSQQKGTQSYVKEAGGSQNANTSGGSKAPQGK
jgi:hypothetical protein